MINATKKSFATPSNKPVDVEYRLKRLRATLAEAQMFLGAIDPEVFPEVHAAIDTALQAASASAWAAKAREAAKATKAAAKAKATKEAA